MGKNSRIEAIDSRRDDGDAVWHGVPATLLASLSGELRTLAATLLRGERADHTLQPTALVNELWLRLADRTDLRFESREAFIAYAVPCVRHILVDHARRRAADRRGGGWTRLTFRNEDRGILDARNGLTGIAPESVECGAGRAFSLAELDDELRLMERSDQRSARVFELRFFGGMSCDQIGVLLGVSGRTIQDDWQAARLWLQHRLDDTSNG